VHSWFWCLNLTDRYDLEALFVSRRRVLKYISKNKMGKREVYCSRSEWGTIVNTVMRFQDLQKAGNFLTN
jgi:hypothetical protein